MSATNYLSESVLENLLEFDLSYFPTKEKTLVIGLDEVGRGAFAGPVVSAAMCLDNCCFADHNVKEITKQFQGHHPSLQFLNDSKKLSKLKRESIVKELKTQNDFIYSVAKRSASFVDREGIVVGIFDSMIENVINILKLHLPQEQDSNDDELLTKLILLVDGPKSIPELEEEMKLHGYMNPVEQYAIKKGDSQSFTIAAAANIAKVYRDDLMKQLAEQEEYSVYQWQKNAGYGTKAHRDALLEHGLTDQHRLSFCRNHIETTTQL